MWNCGECLFLATLAGGLGVFSLANVLFAHSDAASVIFVLLAMVCFALSTWALTMKH